MVKLLPLGDVETMGLLFSLDLRSRENSRPMVSTSPRGNSFHHLPHEQSIFVYYRTIRVRMLAPLIKEPRDLFWFESRSHGLQGERWLDR